MALVLSRKESGSSSACRAKDQSEASISRQRGPMRAHLEAGHVVDDEDLPEDADHDPAQGEDGLGLQLQGELGDEALQETWRGGDRDSSHPPTLGDIRELKMKGQSISAGFRTPLGIEALRQDFKNTFRIHIINI